MEEIKEYPMLAIRRRDDGRSLLQYKIYFNSGLNNVDAYKAVYPQLSPEIDALVAKYVEIAKHEIVELKNDEIKYEKI